MLVDGNFSVPGKENAGADAVRLWAFMRSTSSASVISGASILTMAISGRVSSSLRLRDRIGG